MEIEICEEYSTDEI